MAHRVGDASVEARRSKREREREQRRRKRRERREGENEERQKETRRGKRGGQGTSLGVQQLRLQAHKAGNTGSILGQGTRTCVP